MPSRHPQFVPTITATSRLEVFLSEALIADDDKPTKSRSCWIFHTHQSTALPDSGSHSVSVSLARENAT